MNEESQKELDEKAFNALVKLVINHPKKEETFPKTMKNIEKVKQLSTKE